MPLMVHENSGPAPAVVVAMKGHPGSGKSTAERAIAASLRSPLLDKDDVRDCTLPLEGAVAAGTLNELSYAVLWLVVERQVRLGLSVVVDSPLSRRAHLEALTRLPDALVVVVECRAARLMRKNGDGGWRSVGHLWPMVAGGISQRLGANYRSLWKGTRAARIMT